MHSFNFVVANFLINLVMEMKLKKKLKSLPVNFVVRKKLLYFIWMKNSCQLS